MSEQRDSNLIREQRAQVISGARLILDTAKADNARELTDEENVRFNELMKSADELQRQAEQAALEEELVEAERSVVKPQPRKLTLGAAQHAYNMGDGFRAWAVAGANGNVSSKDLDAAAAHGFNLKSPFTTIRLNGDILRGGKRTDLKTNLGAGFIQDEFSTKFSEALKWYGGVLEAGAEVIVTKTGNDHPIGTWNDTGNVGEVIDEGAIWTEDVEATAGVVVLKAYKYHSKVPKYSIEAIQDSTLDLDQQLAKDLPVRIRRKFNVDSTTAAASGSHAFGVVTQATNSGVTAAITGPTYANFIDMIAALDQDYLPGAKFMMAPSLWAWVEKLEDDNGRPLVSFDGFGEKVTRRIRGYEVVLNSAMASIGASAKVVLFGDFSYYKVRICQDVVVTRLVEKYAEYGLIGFSAYARMDGQLVNPGVAPVLYMACAAS